jgi:hypothetical protein
MELYNQLTIVAFVIVVLGATLYVLRKRGLVQFSPGRGFSSAQRSLRVEDRILLTPQYGLCVVRWEDRKLLVAFSPSGCQVLDGGAPPETGKP